MWPFKNTFKASVCKDPECGVLFTRLSYRTDEENQYCPTHAAPLIEKRRVQGEVNDWVERNRSFILEKIKEEKEYHKKLRHAEMERNSARQQAMMQAAMSSAAQHSGYYGELPGTGMFNQSPYQGKRAKDDEPL